MGDKKIKNLVICSTLNQITNYLIIEKYNKPERIFNITFEDDSKFNINIKPKKWDEWLAKEVIDKKKFDNNIEITNEEMYSVQDIKDKIASKIPKDEEVYWHITGGQRTIALAISKLLDQDSRKNDKIIYIEGNTEKLIINDYKCEFLECTNYNCNKLTFKQALNLVGFDTKNLDSTIKLKEKGEKILEYGKEYKFYEKLYEIACSKNGKLNLDGEDFIDKSDDKEFYHDTFRNLLLKSNVVCKKENITKNKNVYRKRFVKCLFKKLIDTHQELKNIEYYNEELSEINKSYPAGYIFEKIMAYKIYDLIRDNCKVIGMATSLKTYFYEEKYGITDEIDIALLTDTGKIINFECKSGGMEGDNAKSNKYTTYRLAGVFGMPILLSPLYEYEITNGELYENETFKNQMQAVRAAKRAELEVFTIDKIECGLKKLQISEEDIESCEED